MQKLLLLLSSGMGVILILTGYLVYESTLKHNQPEFLGTSVFQVFQGGTGKSTIGTGNIIVGKGLNTYVEVSSTTLPYPSSSLTIDNVYVGNAFGFAEASTTAPWARTFVNSSSSISGGWGTSGSSSVHYLSGFFDKPVMMTWIGCNTSGNTLNGSAGKTGDSVKIQFSNDGTNFTPVLVCRSSNYNSGKMSTTSLSTFNTINKYSNVYWKVGSASGTSDTLSVTIGGRAN